MNMGYDKNLGHEAPEGDFEPDPTFNAVVADLEYDPMVNADRVYAEFALPKGS